MKIGVVTPYDLALPSGVNSSIIPLARWMREGGHDVRVYGPTSAQREPASANGVPGNGFPVVTTHLGRPRSLRWGGAMASISLSPLGAHRLASTLRAERFDVIHVHEPLLSWPVIQFLASPSTGLVGTFHSAEQVAARGYRLAGWALRRWLARFDVLTAVSSAAATTARPVLPNQCEIVPVCIDVEHYATPHAKPVALSGDRRTVLFVGRADPRKGLSDLIEAFARLRVERDDLRLVIVGPDARACARLARDPRLAGKPDVVIAGTVAAATLAGYYQSADVFCSPATGGEAFGLVLIEAMAAGAPVVASDIEGYRDVVRHQVDGLLTPRSNPARLAAALSRLLDDETLRHSLQDAGRRRADTYSTEIVGQQLLDLYDRQRRGHAVPRTRGAFGALTPRKD
jgi:phosphatidylinositol alpha-mannosyltransferase